MTTETYDTIVRVLADKFETSGAKVHPDAALEDLGLDSLSLMEFMFAIEDAFGIRIPEEQLDPRQGGITLGHMESVIQAHLHQLALTGTVPA